MPETADASAARRSRVPSWTGEALWVVATGLIAFVVAVWAFKIWRGEPRLPIVAQGGDYTVDLVTVKTMITHGWYWNVPELGAPNGLSFYDFPLFFGDLWHYSLMKAYSIFSQDWVLVYNMFMLSGYALGGMCAFGVQRDLGVSRPVALVTSVLFATLPSHYFTMNSPQGSEYSVPLAVWLVIVILTGRPVWSWRGRVPLPTVKVAIAAVVLAGASVYWAIFCLVLLAVAAPVAAFSSWSWKPLARAAMVMVFLGFLLFLTQFPTILYQLREGANPVAAMRQPIESEIYGLKLADLLIPSIHHPIGFLARAGQHYAFTTTLPQEDVWASWLGTTGTVGFLIGIAYLLRTGLRRMTVLAAAAATALLGLLISWTGGVSSLIAFYISPQIRGWDRMATVVGFASLLCVALLLDRLRIKVKAPEVPKRGLAFAAGLALLFVLGVFDQKPKDLGSQATYDALNSTWRQQVRYTAAVVAKLPKKDASVLQLPYVPFPENGPIRDMPDYEEIRPFVQTTAPVHWSSGAMKGRPTDWGPEIANWSTPELLRRAAAAGFDGLWIDRRAYEDRGQKLVADASKVLGGAGALGSFDGSIAYFDLQPLEAKLAQTTTPGQRRTLGLQLTDPIAATFGTGFGDVESAADDSWRWLGGTGELQVRNPTDQPTSVALSATAFRGVATAESSVAVTAPAQCAKTIPVGASGTPVSITCNVPPGDTTLQFKTTGPSVPVTPDQPRSGLNVRLSGLKVLAGGR